jgi:predicted DNA-binding WGR domain protein
MKTPFTDVPAAHSMDTEWFALDTRGHVAVFSTLEDGALPNGAVADQEGDRSATFGLLLDAASSKLSKARWRHWAHQDELAVIGATTDLLDPLVRDGSLRRTKAGALVLYTPVDELEEEALEPFRKDKRLLGVLTFDDILKLAGFARYENDDHVPGSYRRSMKPGSPPRLSPAWMKRLGKLVVPGDFSKLGKVELWSFLDDSKATWWNQKVGLTGLDLELVTRLATPTHLEYFGKGQQAFWEAWAEGPAMHVRAGTVGSAGKRQTKTFASDTAALAAVHAAITEKTKAGYRPAGEAQAAAVAGSEALVALRKALDGFARTMKRTDIYAVALSAERHHDEEAPTERYAFSLACGVASEVEQRTKRLLPKSTLLRRSAFARRCALKWRVSDWATKPIGLFPLDAFQQVDVAAEVRARFPRALILAGHDVLAEAGLNPKALEAPTIEERDAEVATWNALADLTAAELIEARVEDHVVFGSASLIRKQAFAMICSDPKFYVSAVLDALERDFSKHEGLAPLFEEEPVKAFVRKTPAVVERLVILLEQTGQLSIGFALRRVGFPEPTFDSKSKRVSNIGAFLAHARKR